MKEKIFNALKQKYSNLGLGDETLMSVAESLAATGIVTDDNLDTVVAGQGVMLKSYQSTFDKMRTESANYKKEIETLKNKGGNNNEPDKNEMPEWFKAYKKEQEEKLNTLITDKQKAEAEKAAQQRRTMILDKAKALGISAKRIDEGFAISDDMDEKAIDTYLEKVKTNDKARNLEENSPFRLSTTTEENNKMAEEWANSLPDKD